MNKAIITGQLGQDPVTRNTEKTTLCNFSIATDEHTGGEKSTQWHRIVAFGRLAEICGEYLHKGSLVSIVGRIQYRKWTDKNGFIKDTTEIVANEMEMLSKPPSGGGRPQRNDQDRRPPRSAQKTYDQHEPPAGDDEMPF